jgi:uncharacterized protein (DUF433 family)
MSTLVQYPHLSIDPDGDARIEGTRYKVVHIGGEHYHYGWGAEELLRQHPDLRPEQVYAALTYFYDHRDELVRRMRETAEVAQREAGKQPFTRAELLRRRESRGS